MQTNGDISLDFSLAPAVWTLIAVNCVVSVYAMYAAPDFFKQSMFSIRHIRERNQWYRLVTAGFLHGSPLHLFVNMFSLYIFGPTVEMVLGTATFLIVYFGSLLAADAFSLAFKWKEPEYNAVGASGAVSGVVLSYCTFAPFENLYFLGIVPIPAIVFAGLYMAYTTFVMNRESRIAHEAHLGGALGGIVLTLLLRQEAIVGF